MVVQKGLPGLRGPSPTPRPECSSPGGTMFVRLHRFTSDSGGHDTRIFSGRRGGLPFWTHLRPEFGQQVRSNAYLNRLQLDDWVRLFESRMHGCAVVALCNAPPNRPRGVGQAEVGRAIEQLLGRGTAVGRSRRVLAQARFANDGALSRSGPSRTLMADLGGDGLDDLDGGGAGADDADALAGERHRLARARRRQRLAGEVRVPGVNEAEKYKLAIQLR